ncbi:hypothetical protein WIW50_17445 [Flavobacteriaceae bacterium 3-367]
MKLKKTIVTLLGVAFALSSNAEEPGNLKTGFTYGNPGIKSIKAIAFGPENILFIGDNTGMTVYAVDVQDTQEMVIHELTLEGLDKKLAAAMGASTKDITILDMAVNPASKNVFFAVSKKNGEETSYALFRLGKDGLGEFPLENVSHSKKEITNAPAADHKTWKRPSRTYTVTDMHYVNGELIISGLSNEEFSSGLRRVAFPFDQDMLTTNVQVYHVSHGRNETHAPIYRFLPVQLENQWHVVAGYMCTPLVTFKLSELNGNKKLVGKTVAEIGAGNTPTGIISYTHKGKDYVLVGNNVHPLTKISGKDLFNAKAITAPSRERGVKRENIKLGSISHISDYDSTYILVMLRDKKSDSYNLKLISKDEV